MEESKSHFSLLGLLAFLAFLAFISFLIWRTSQSASPLTTSDIQKAREVVRRMES